MFREVTYRRNAEGEFIDLIRGGRNLQRIHLEDAEPEQKAEIFHLSRQWQGQKEPSTPAHTTVRHKARFISDMQMSHRIADLASKMFTHNAIKKPKKHPDMKRTRKAKERTITKKQILALRGKE